MLLMRYVVVAVFLLNSCGKGKKDEEGVYPTPTTKPTAPNPPPAPPTNPSQPNSTPVPNPAVPANNQGSNLYPSDNGSKELRVVDGKAGIQLAVSGLGLFSGAELTALDETVKRLKNLQSAASSSGIFQKIFSSLEGSTDREKIANYILGRTRYLIKDTQSERGTLASNTAAYALIPLLNRYISGGLINSKAETVKQYPFNGKSLLVDRPGMGIIELADLYFTAPGRTSLDRLATLLHESRHTDCWKAPNPNELIDYLTADGSLSGCFNPHAKCPTGHDLAGEYACDDKPWGSYAVTLALQNLLARDCKNCSDQEVIHAMAMEKDARSRILILDDMLAGKFEAPNLTVLTNF